MDCSDLLWDTELSPDGTVILHRSTQGPPALKLETVRGHWRQVLTGAGFGFIIAYTLFLNVVYFSILLYSLLAAFQLLPSGAGRVVLLVLTCIMEVPLLLGFVQVFIVSTFAKVLNLYVKEELDIDGSGFRYTPSWPCLLQSLGKGQYALVNADEDITHLSSMEIVTYPPGTPGRLFLTAGLQFGIGLTERDILFVQNQVIDYLTITGLSVHQCPPGSRRPVVLTASVSNSELKFQVNFNRTLSLFRQMGAFLSLWLSPTCIALPLIWLYTLDEQQQGDGPMFAIVWVATHLFVYLYWVVKDLISLTVVVDKKSGSCGMFQVRRHLLLAPGISVPFLVLDGWRPTIAFERRLSLVDSVSLEPVTSEGREVGQRIVIDLAPPHATSISLPMLPYHESYWLLRQLSIALGKTQAQGDETDEEVAINC